ncbi:lytic transglycosylase domain-containing protein [Pandoraea fibrosis]|uniref:Peptidoglycan N-acetylmuramoylhydrolase n=1 Tax=Pandoraea fibrosis TaxID=1891094 RepID=A0A5E4WW77_9BURK|nr:lytic transglycosylase domain-containing protein [Pandoraea fibrosis]VVE27156.1 peptidoglycan N-acetylmuramoylhydrolase [Pandoraea fibrosis]
MSAPLCLVLRVGARGCRSLRLVVFAMCVLSLSMPAIAGNHGLLPLHPRVADARLLVPEPRAIVNPPSPLVDARVTADVPVVDEPNTPKSAPIPSTEALVSAEPAVTEAPLALAPTPTASSQARPFDMLVQRAAEVASVDAALLHAIIDVESGYDPQAVSGKGAIGLMQVLPRTGERFGVRRLEDPAENVRAGASYLRWLLTRFDGDLPLVLAAYNAGEGAVLRYGRQIPPFPETQNYVRKVMAGYSRLRTTNGPETIEPQRHRVPRGSASRRPAVGDIATTRPAPTPSPKAPHVTPPAKAAQTDDVAADRALRLLRGLGTLLTRSPSVEAAGGRTRDQPAVLMP